jgi:2-oxoglutarate ferredoxin oxidoreductase subunit alpha
MSEVSIVICGQAGQGIQTVEQLFSRVLKKHGLYVFSTKEYMSRVRGGSNSTLIRISTTPVRSYIGRIDFFIPLSEDAFDHVKRRITNKTVIIGEKKHIGDAKGFTTIELNLTEIARSIGNPVFSNIIAVGFLSSLCSIERTMIQKEVSHFFSDKKEDTIEKNIAAVKKGYSIGKDLKQQGKLSVDLTVSKKNNMNIFLNGTTAIGLGAIAGGCNFVSSYPMSPSTGVLTFLSKHADDNNIIVEQAEDEISAINMVLGAWYAGARGMVTTSGGGFALMAEGVSLAGMIESPVVIHIAQRPGPATGLPTRTEQADLEHVLYSGHGEFPRIIFAPGTLEDAFYLTQKAFNLADQFQVPVFIVSDQYFVDSYYQITPFNLDDVQNHEYIIKTKEEYNRYGFTDTGISPRGIPGFGSGLVCLDSDEHDEQGSITEDMDMRTKMVDKRLRKLDEIEKRTIPPKFLGNKEYKILVLSWGSTYHTVTEALQKINNEGISHLHFSQIYPLHKDTHKYLEKADITIIIENNATAQFAKLIKSSTGYSIQHAILQYTGLPFSVETIESELKHIIEGE